MDVFEISVDDELFRISERYQPDGRLSCDYSWLNGPAVGTYGFTIGRSGGEAAPNDSDGASRMSREALVEEARSFLDSFYAAGGVGEEDFPDHIPTRIHGNIGG
ncbi:hypothetical protein SAMN04489740_1117 [Arthrobacter alpinus]|uniref:Uncharacterized protein n=1 Tax=Arthrobacter alpinus TaxID=656366 RepID=A0A1H5HV65_9MICC|nr:hypothetical protein [Arthrobacter alpinus]SEE31837.1 hypothetical protein SAMN04489740_1117 [Arthrobacter alpinus]